MELNKQCMNKMSLTRNRSHYNGFKQNLELKNSMTELSNSIESFNNRLGQTEEIISELEDWPFKISQRNKKKNGNE